MQNRRNMRFEDVIRLWLESIALEFKRSSYDRYECITDALCKFFYAKEIAQIDNNTLNAFLTERQINGWQYETLVLAIGVIKKIICFSIDQGFIQNLDFKPFKFRKKYRKIESLTVAESVKVNTLFSNAKTGSKLATIIALHSGLRVGEVCALRWKNIDFTRKSIKVNSSVHRIKCSGEKTKTKLVIQKPKTESSEREVPISDYLCEILSEHRSDKELFVLTGSECIPDPRTVQGNFTAFSIKTFGKSLCFHCLRHTFATLLISQGVDVKTVSEILGHSSVITTLNIYRSVSFDDKALGVKTLESLIAPKS